MPSILKLRPLAIGDISESLFLGGTQLSEQTDTSFTTQSGDYTLHFTGTGLTYDANGMVTGGQVDEYRVYSQGVAIDHQIVIVNSSTTLLTGSEIAQAFALHASGDAAGANALVMASWQAEYFSESDYSDDNLHGYSGNEFLASYGQNTTISGLEGNDTLLVGWHGGTAYGGSGNDALYSNSGNDFLYGGEGNDTLMYHGSGHDPSSDLLSGGNGDDVISGHVGHDTILGEAGNDSLYGTLAYGGAGNDMLTGFHSADYLTGGNGDDRLTGNAGSDSLYGGGNDDVLYGGAGNDVLSGGAGFDQLFGGFGNNTLTGGAGRDIFVFAPSLAHDVITDFELGHDQIWITHFHFASLAAVSAALTDTGSGDTLMEFGNGQTLLVQGVSAADLLADIVF